MIFMSHLNSFKLVYNLFNYNNLQIKTSYERAKPIIISFSEICPFKKISKGTLMVLLFRALYLALNS